MLLQRLRIHPHGNLRPLLCCMTYFVPLGQEPWISYCACIACDPLERQIRPVCKRLRTNAACLHVGRAKVPKIRIMKFFDEFFNGLFIQLQLQYFSDTSDFLPRPVDHPIIIDHYMYGLSYVPDEIQIMV